MPSWTVQGGGNRKRRGEWEKSIGMGERLIAAPAEDGIFVVARGREEHVFLRTRVHVIVVQVSCCPPPLLTSNMSPPCPHTHTPVLVTDCVMLSGETAKGKWPIRAVEVMGEICREAENAIDYEQLHRELRDAKQRLLPVDDPATSSLRAKLAVAEAATFMSVDASAVFILVLGEHRGNTAKAVSMFRPPVPVLVATSNDDIARRVRR